MWHYTSSVQQPHGFLKVRMEVVSSFLSIWLLRWGVWWALHVAWWCVNRSRYWIAKRPAQKGWVRQSFKQPNSGGKKNYQEALTQDFAASIACSPISLSSEYQKWFFSKPSMPSFFQIQEHSIHQTQPSSFLSPWPQQLEHHKIQVLAFLKRYIYF